MPIIAHTTTESTVPASATNRPARMLRQRWSQLPAAQRARIVRSATLVAVTATLVLLPTRTFAAPLSQADFSIPGFAATTLTYVKQAWALVSVVEIFAVIYYMIAYFTQGIMPALFQPVSGPWVKTAVMVGIGGQLAMAVLVGLATASAGGWTGS